MKDEEESKHPAFVLASSIKQLPWPAAVSFTTEDQDQRAMCNVNEYQYNKELFSSLGLAWFKQSHDNDF